MVPARSAVATARRRGGGETGALLVSEKPPLAGSPLAACVVVR
jgi:hypothetical protein